MKNKYEFWDAEEGTITAPETFLERRVIALVNRSDMNWKYNSKLIENAPSLLDSLRDVVYLWKKINIEKLYLDSKNPKASISRELKKRRKIAELAIRAVEDIDTFLNEKSKQWESKQ